MQFFKTALAALGLLGLTGCGGYLVGPTLGHLPPGASIAVEPFQNQTGEPLLSGPVATALRRVFQQDGTFRLASGNDGQVVLRGTLARYSRNDVSSQRADLRVPQDFDLVLVAKVIATERATGKVLFEGDVTGRSTVRMGTDQASAERQVLPLLAEDLARKIAVQLTDGSW